MNVGDKPAAVVLSIEKYNQLVSRSGKESVRELENSELVDQMISRSVDRQISESVDQRVRELESESVRVLENSKSVDQLIDLSSDKRVLVTGGAGYIGSHTVRKLLQNKYKVTVLDNLSTGKMENLPKGADFVEGDLADVNLLRDIFQTGRFECVMHFAASVEVEESVREPEKYLKNNVLNTANLLFAMTEAGINKLILSSTAAVYDSKETPIKETDPLRPENPYGQSKLLSEALVKYYAKNSGLSAVIFRYFNACGCDPSNPIKPTHESHLLPIVMQAAKGLRPHLTVFGNDYKTPDGSCVRDYVHVMDIAEAHILGMGILGKPGCQVFNIGTGKGRSVLEMVSASAEVLNRMVPMEMGERRPGDAPMLVADSSKIKKVLGFEPKYSDLAYIVKSTWKMV